MFFPCLVHGQDTIFIKNKSFEGRLEMDNNPTAFNLKYWRDCGYTRYFKKGHYESPPDIHPNNFHGVKMEASDGKTYIGLVVRDINTWEAISQKLDNPLMANQCYEFTIELAKSPVFKNMSRKYNEEADFLTNAKFRMWGSIDECSESQLLAESPLIYFNYWQPFKFTIKPNQQYHYITIEAIYENANVKPYNGHILVDNMSDFKLIPCK